LRYRERSGVAFPVVELEDRRLGLLTESRSRKEVESACGGSQAHGCAGGVPEAKAMDGERQGEGLRIVPTLVEQTKLAKARTDMRWAGGNGGPRMRQTDRAKQGGPALVHFRDVIMVSLRVSLSFVALGQQHQR
jgi:hypothetical protein